MLHNCDAYVKHSLRHFAVNALRVDVVFVEIHWCGILQHHCIHVLDRYVQVWWQGWGWHREHVVRLVCSVRLQLTCFFLHVCRFRLWRHLLSGSGQ